jgi:hemerythrin
MSHAPSPAAPLAWHDDLLLGHRPMDDEHEVLVALIADLCGAPDAALPARLEALAVRLQAHFDEEDTWMRTSDFPPRDCHIGEHAAVLRSVAAVQRRLTAGDVPAARRLAAELEAWFPGHVLHLDSALAHWLHKNRFGGKPVVVRRRAAAPAGESRC